MQEIRAVCLIREGRKLVKYQEIHCKSETKSVMANEYHERNNMSIEKRSQEGFEALFRGMLMLTFVQHFFGAWSQEICSEV